MTLTQAAKRRAVPQIQIGITMQYTDRTLGPVEMARAIEERGFDAWFVPEHSHIPTSRRSPWPGSKTGDDPLPDVYWHLQDPIVTLSMAAAVTTRIELGTSVVLVPQHDPIWLAKQIATLDRASNGRVVFGIGFGWNREQTESHGIDFATRRERTRECIGLMRSLWTDDISAYHGKQVHLEPSLAWPKPAQPGGPQVLIGGGWGPKLFDAIADYADGWMPVTARASIADRASGLRERWERAGRDPDALQICVMGATGDPKGLRQLAADGVQRAMLTVWHEDRDDVLRELDRFAAVAAAVRAG
jgi:probable F420-dependent oxidoreductase